MDTGEMVPAAPTTFMDRLLLAQTTVDYDVACRGEEGLIERLLEDRGDARHAGEPRARGGAQKERRRCPGRARLRRRPSGAPPRRGGATGPLALALLSAEAVREEARRPGCIAIYLGVDRTAEPKTPYIALDITRAAEGPAAPRPEARAPCGRGPRAPRRLLRRAGAPRLSTGSSSGRSPRARPRATPGSPRARSPSPCGTRISGSAPPAAPRCARRSPAGRRCTGEADGRRLLFPRIEPAIITAIVDDRDRILLQHNTAWRERFYSVSAGFVETGESLEHAVRREAEEETGVVLDTVRYLGSQPWPFPASLMLGFTAHAATTEIAVDHDEVSDARWFTRDELARAIERDGLELPGRASIARHLIEHWYGAQLG